MDSSEHRDSGAGLDTCFEHGPLIEADLDYGPPRLRRPVSGVELAIDDIVFRICLFEDWLAERGRDAMDVVSGLRERIARMFRGNIR